MRKLVFIKSLARPVFEGDADDKVTMTKAELQAQIATATAEVKKQQQQALAELQALQGKAQLTAKERQQLEQKLEELTTQSLTKEELAKREIDKTKKKYDQELATTTQERDLWKTKFTETTILRTIADAANSNEAFNPNQIIAILRGDTQLKEGLDAEGRPTGQFEARVKFKDTKDNQPIELDLSVTEAVKRMREIEGYQNLFKGQGNGGQGNPNRGGGAKIDISKLTPQQYRELRAKGQIPGLN